MSYKIDVKDDNPGRRGYPKIIGTFEEREESQELLRNPSRSLERIEDVEKIRTWNFTQAKVVCQRRT
jgi:hypothetical protein